MTADPAERACVLNHHGQVCPVWVRGELHLYAAASTSSSVPHPDTGEPLARTGLLARRLPGGAIERLSHPGGRARLRGLEIDLGLVEHLIARHPDIGECAVQLRDAGGAPLLWAYVATRAPRADQEVAPEALGGALAGALPEFLLPARIVALPALPRRPDGTIDRTALGLAAPDGPTTSPRTEREAMLRQIWAEALGLPEDAIPLDRGFFDLGANSLLLVRVADRVRARTGRRLEIADYFRHLTIEALARALERDGQRDDRSEDQDDDVVARSRSRAAARRDWLRSRTPAAGSGGQVLADLDHRAELKARDLGLRQVRPGEPVTALPRVELPGASLAEINEQRTSTRALAATPVPLERFAGVLHVLARRPTGDGFRCAYGSAGALYPVRLYAVVRPGRITGLPGGGYYYQPQLHQLIRIGDLAIPTTGIPPVNREVFATAGWMFVLIAQTTAIAALYGEAEATRHTMIEAGLIAQLLEQAAAAFGLGSCQIGVPGWTGGDLSALLGLESTEIYLHALLGGAR